ncbi:MAG: lysophospholipid acyltransferase family protein, partial [Muribaculaceae bacterium]|nr:lysophospholipid acyltransferase family protein [Muribaculaceae bacterium]
LKGNADPSQIYHPLENAAADRAFARIRSRFGCNNVPMRDTLRYLTAKHNEGLTTITGFIADQSPLYTSTHLWLDFLNHETGVFTGPEKIMRRYAGAMVYCHIERPRRGYYHCRFELICDDVTAVPEFQPTRTYFSKLEAQIIRTPHLWLWSHRRWKRPRPSTT